MTTTAMDTVKAAHAIFADGIQYLDLCRQLSLPALKAVMSDVAAAAHFRACHTFFGTTSFTKKQAEVSQVLFRLSRWENLEYAKKI